MMKDKRPHGEEPRRQEEAAKLYRTKAEDVEKRLQRLEKKATQVVIAFGSDSTPPTIVPDNILAHPKDDIHWHVIAGAGVNLHHVDIVFESGDEYFPGSGEPHRTTIQYHAGIKKAKGKVPKKDPGVDKYTVRWQITGQPKEQIDPTIIVTDP